MRTTLVVFLVVLTLLLASSPDHSIAEKTLVEIESLELLVANSDTGVDSLHFDIEVDENFPGTGGHWIVDLGGGTRVLKIGREFNVKDRIACKLYGTSNKLIGTVTVRANQDAGEHKDFFEADRGVYKLTWRIYANPIVVDGGVVVLATKPSRVWVYSDGVSWGKYEKFRQRWKHTQEKRGGSRPIIQYYEGGATGRSFVQLHDGQTTVRLYSNAATSSTNELTRFLYRGAWLKSSAGGTLTLTDDQTEITFDNPMVFNVPRPVDTSVMSDRERLARAAERREAARREFEKLDKNMREAKARREAAERASTEEERKRIELARRRELEFQQREAARLKSIARELAVDNAGKYEPKHRTFCNHFVRDFARAFAGKDLPELFNKATAQPYLANEMHERLMMTAVSHMTPPRLDPQWKFVWSDLGYRETHALITAEQKYTAMFRRSHELANQGKLVVVAWNNKSGTGHVAVVVPSKVMVSSKKWGRLKVPFIAQAGRRVERAVGLNYGFVRDDIDLTTVGTTSATFNVAADLQLFYYDP